MKYLVLVIVSICISLFLSCPAAAQDKPPLELASIDMKLSTLVYGFDPALIGKVPQDYIDRVTLSPVTIAAAQAEYFSRHGRYWQGLITHEAIPTVDTATAPSLATHPTDQAETWRDIGLDLKSSDLAIRVDVYESPSGWGYTVTGMVEIGGQVWERIVNYGPEDRLGTDWKPRPIEQETTPMSATMFISPLEP